MPTVNPSILSWARITAGLSLEEAAHAVDLKDAHGKTGSERLDDLEKGLLEPSSQILEKMAEKYRRSLIVFYLNQPPQKGDRGQDFRTLSKNQDSVSFRESIDILLRDIKVRQGIVKSLLEDEETPLLAFVGSATETDSPNGLAERIASELNFNLNEFRTARGVSRAFDYVRQRVENSGIFVLLIGDLGSHHTKFPLEAFRGFALADPVAPFIAINNHDAKVSWSFTLLHEVVHIFLGTSGVSNNSDEILVEQYCNSVAANILLPVQELGNLNSIEGTPFNEAVELISAFASERNVSRSMIAYALFKNGIVSRVKWLAFTKQFDSERVEFQESEKQKQKNSIKGGPNYYVVHRHYLGQALLGLVDRAINEGSLSPIKAGRILGVKPKNVRILLEKSNRRGNSS